MKTYLLRDQVLVVIASLEIAAKVSEKVAQIGFDGTGSVHHHEATEEPEETSRFYPIISAFSDASVARGDLLPSIISKYSFTEGQIRLLVQ